MKNLILKDLVKNSSSNEEGMVLFNVFQEAYLNNTQILLEIGSDISMSSSFLNTSIGEFLDKYGFLKFKETVKIKGSENQFNRLNNYINKYKDLYIA
ncbi:STAS-like domain-containing protein [Winogradskyella sediminis]|uniref:DUF4325 domain-containing protein n=1 Tax=Winogradskyella sediminis TaxID=1382466 RepID=A0A1H1S219_9FLAO|nr:DUF4325 domain-containing protein [Winogradskyella sediminis]SDS41913.1 hypothetical protein SAMN04489797_1561 [Winogradskyella sediminis]